jgi:hypothetical protein
LAEKFLGLAYGFGGAIASLWSKSFIVSGVGGSNNIYYPAPLLRRLKIHLLGHIYDFFMFSLVLPWWLARYLCDFQPALLFSELVNMNRYYWYHCASIQMIWCSFMIDPTPNFCFLLRPWNAISMILAFLYLNHTNIGLSWYSKSWIQFINRPCDSLLWKDWWVGGSSLLQNILRPSADHFKCSNLLN